MNAASPVALKVEEGARHESDDGFFCTDPFVTVMQRSKEEDKICACSGTVVHDSAES